MQKRFISTRSFVGILAVLVLLGCKMPRDRQTNAGKIPHVPNQLLVLFSEKTNPDQIAQFRSDVRKRYKEFQYKQCHCSLQLELWEGDNIDGLLGDTSIIKGEISQTSRTGVRSDGDTVSISLNLINKIKDGSKGFNKMNYQPRSDSGRTLIAVLDTGLDTSLFTSKSYRHFLVSPRQLPLDCKADALYAGWNFVDSNANFTDDFPALHGTNVTGLILNECDRQSVHILPLKTHGKDGTGSLFDAICAMKYAKKAGAKLLNASWGEYGEPNAVFERTLEELQKSNMLMIAAAGNEGVDIGKRPFFPAAYSSMGNADAHPNVITVTTVRENDTCHHNYSSVHVDVGAVGRNDCLFGTPFGSGHFISGTSFATPVITGKIADRLDSPGGDSKTQILSAMSASTNLHSIPAIRTGDGFKQH